MSSDVTKIELAKALKAIKSVSTEDQFEQIKRIYFEDGLEESVMNAVNGLSEEDEFAMMTKLLGTATHIIGLEQRPIIAGDYIVPDFFVQFKMGNVVNRKTQKDFGGFKCLVEVKSTSKDNFKLSGSKLRKLRNTADLMGLPLLIAIRFIKTKQNAHWAIIEDDRNSASYSLTNQAVIEGIRNVLWNEFALTTSAELIVQSEFSKSSKSNALKHKEYGRQISVRFSNGKNVLVQRGIEASMTFGLMEAFGLKQIKAEQMDSDRTILYFKPIYLTVFLADLIYQINKLFVDKKGSTIYDPSKLLVRSDAGAHDRVINRKNVEMLMLPLIENDFLLVESIGDLSVQLQTWKKFGGVS